MIHYILHDSKCSYQTYFCKGDGKMGEKNDNPHVHDYEHVALVFVDMISDFSFKDGDKLFPHTFMAAQKMAQLKAGAKKLNIPTLYVNDNYGRWQSDFPGIVEEMKQSEQGKKSSTFFNLITMTILF